LRKRSFEGLANGARQGGVEGSWTHFSDRTVRYDIMVLALCLKAQQRCEAWRCWVGRYDKHEENRVDRVEASREAQSKKPSLSVSCSLAVCVPTQHVRKRFSISNCNLTGCTPTSGYSSSSLHTVTLRHSFKVHNSSPCPCHITLCNVHKLRCLQNPRGDRHRRNDTLVLLRLRRAVGYSGRLSQSSAQDKNLH